jgi:uncharacterized protein (DUF2141 family)
MCSERTPSARVLPCPTRVRAWKQVGLALACGWLMHSLGCDSTRDIPPNHSTAPGVPTTAPANQPDEPAVERDAESPKVENVSLTLRVHITGFKKDNGNCRVALYGSAAHFNDPEHALAKASLEIRDSQAEWNVVVDLPTADRLDSDSLEFPISISAYHDENENSKLDKNALGIPTELYGFSQNPKRGFGPPKFKETALSIAFDRETLRPLDMQEISIQIK